MTTEELIERAKSFEITVEQKGPYGLYDVSCSGGRMHAAVPASALARILTTFAKEQAKTRSDFAALLPF